MINSMFVRGVGIRDKGLLLEISNTRVLKVLKTTRYEINPKQINYDSVKTAEFGTYIGEKKNKIWLIDAKHRENGRNCGVCVGKWDLETAKELSKRIQGLGIRYDGGNG
ncbi:hypothetical protein Holit_01345 [Hollandina sp. SP2]